MTTKNKILEFIKSQKSVRANDIYRKFLISRVMTHKYLKMFQENGNIIKSGKSPAVFYTYQHSKNVLSDILSKIKPYNPKKVILFGSRAYGTPHKDSDYDIAIIKETEKPYHDRLIEVRNLVRTPSPIDFFVFTQDEIEKYQKYNPIVQEIMTKGKIIYE